MQIQISWSDLDLHCLQRQDISGFSSTRVNFFFLFFLEKEGFDTSCILSPKDTICMKCQILHVFSRKNKKKKKSKCRLLNLPIAW